MDVRRHVLPSSTNFPLTIDNCSIVEESATRYFGSRIWPIFTNLAIFVNSNYNNKSRISIVCFEFQILILEHEFLFSKRFLVLDLMIQISDPVMFFVFFVQVNMPKI